MCKINLIVLQAETEKPALMSGDFKIAVLITVLSK